MEPNQHPSYGRHLNAGIALWRAACRWRRCAQAALAPAGLSHAQFLVLRCIDVLFQDTGDAVSQIEVAIHSGIDRSTTSAVMRALDEAGLIDRGPSMSGLAYRVILSERGKATLRQCEESIEAACGTFFQAIDELRLLELLLLSGAQNRADATK